MTFEEHLPLLKRAWLVDRTTSRNVALRVQTSDVIVLLRLTTSDKAEVVCTAVWRKSLSTSTPPGEYAAGDVFVSGPDRALFLTGESSRPLGSSWASSSDVSDDDLATASERWKPVFVGPVVLGKTRLKIALGGDRRFVSEVDDTELPVEFVCLGLAVPDFPKVFAAFDVTTLADDVAACEVTATKATTSLSDSLF